MWIGALTPGAEGENSLQGEKDYNPRLRCVRVCSCSSLCFCDFRRDSYLGEFLQTLAIATTMQENCIPGYKPVDSSVGILSSSMEARIIREDGTDGGAGEPGELWAKGDGILKGTSTTKRPLRGHSPRTGGSRRAISSPLTRREISSEIPCGRLTRLTFVDLTQSDI